MDHWGVGLIALPLALGLVAYLGGRRLVNLLAAAAPLGMAALLLGLGRQVIQYGPVRYALGGWGSPLGIELYADGLALVMLMATTVVGSAVAFYAPGYFRGGAHHGADETAATFWPLFFLLWASLNALFLSADVFNLYVTLELLTLASIGLIALAGTTEAIVAALRYLIVGLLGSLLYLMGVALLYGAFGVLDLAMLGERLAADPRGPMAAAMMVAGLLIKAALFPLHFWLPPAHANAPAPVSALLSALVVKGAFYMIVRLWLDVFPAATLSQGGQLLGLLGAGAIVWGSIQAFRAERLKLLVAYSTVAQLGYLFLLFPLASLAGMERLALAGAVCIAVSHALAKAAVFLAAGSIQNAAGHDRIDGLVGIGQRLQGPVTAFALASVSLMGLPPSGGFAGKWMLLLAAIRGGQWGWAVVIVAGGLLAAGYLFRFWSRAMTAAEDQTAEGPPRPWRMDAAAVALGAAAALLALAAAPLVGLLEIAAPLPSDELAEALR